MKEKSTAISGSFSLLLTLCYQEPPDSFDFERRWLTLRNFIPFGNVMKGPTWQTDDFLSQRFKRKAKFKYWLKLFLQSARWSSYFRKMAFTGGLFFAVSGKNSIFNDFLPLYGLPNKSSAFSTIYHGTEEMVLYTFQRH